MLRLQEDARKLLKKMNALTSSFDEYVNFTTKCAEAPDNASAYIEAYRRKNGWK